MLSVQELNERNLHRPGTYWCLRKVCFHFLLFNLNYIITIPSYNWEQIGLSLISIYQISLCLLFPENTFLYHVYPFSCWCEPPGWHCPLLHPALCPRTLTYMGCVTGSHCPLPLCWVWSMGAPAECLRVYQGICCSSSLLGRVLLLDWLLSGSPALSLVDFPEFYPLLFNTPFIKLTLMTQFEWCHLFPARTLTGKISNQENKK